MNKKYLKLTLVGAVLSSAILVTSLTPYFATQNTIKQQHLHENVLLGEKSQPDGADKQFDIDLNLIDKSKITWPTDIYATTNGINLTNNTQVGITVDSRGLTWNKSWPILTSAPNTGYWTNTPAGLINVDYQAKNNNTFEPMVNYKSWTFKVPAGDTRASTIEAGGPASDFTLSETQPLAEIRLPVINAWKWITANGSYRIDWDGFAQFKTVASNEVFPLSAGNLKQLWRYEAPNPVGDANKALSWILNAPFHVFNDYDSGGNLASTKMFAPGTNATTNLISLDINETLFDKTKSALDQNLDAQDLVSVMAENLPENTSGGSLKVIVSPSNGSIEFTYVPEFVFVNNRLQTYTGAGLTKTVTGFNKRTSHVTPKASYPVEFMVHEFMDLVNPNNIVNPQVLENYVDFTNVPAGTNYEIQANPVYDYATGKINFNIRMDRYYVFDADPQQAVIEYSNSDWIPVELTFLPRITSVNVRPDYLKMAADKFEALVIDGAGDIIMSEFNKYAEIKGAIETATLKLVPGSYDVDTGMGLVSFNVYYDRYYAADGTEQTQTSADLKQQWLVELELKPLTTIITSKTNYTPTHRVDRFISEFTDVDGNVTNEAILREYIDLENLPTGYTLKIDNVNINDELAGTISFNVIASKYNDINFVPQTDGIFPIQLLQLLAKNPTTEISAKAEGDYDDTVRLDRFTELFSDANGLVTDLAKLGEFVDVVSLPADATLTVKNVVKTDATGKITFDLEASKYYNETSDLTSSTKSYPIILNLGIKYLPTEITVNTDVVYPERIDRFETKIAELSGTADLQAYLAPMYIIINGDLPTDAIFSVDNVVTDEVTGIITFDLIASTFYDENSDKITDKVIPISLQLRIKYEPTVLAAKAKDDYTATERVDRFEHNIKIFTNADLKDYLSDYVDGIETLAAGSDLSATNISVDSATGIITFTLSTDKYYDADSDLQVAEQTWTLSLELEILYATTNVTAKTGDFTNIVVDQFIPSFTDDQLVVVNRPELEKYVDISSLPADANLSIKDANMTFSTGVIFFKIVADKFYDGESDLITTRSQEYIIELALGIKYQATKISTIKGYDQSENVETFANQIKTLTGDDLKNYLATYIQTKGDVVPTSITSIDVDSIVYDINTGRITFNVMLSEYYDENSAIATDGSFTINLKLAY